MGAGRKTKTVMLKEKSKYVSTVNGSVSARNLRKADLGAVIFGCKHFTYKECMFKQLFGLPAPHFSYVKNINIGLTLFLFNYSDRKLHGIFEATSPGQLNINPYGWTSDGDESTPYEAQVRIRVRRLCRPLTEDQFASIIGENYYAPLLFWFELDRSQTKRLVDLFLSLPALDYAVNLQNPSKWNNPFKSLPTTGPIDAVDKTKDWNLEERSDHLDHAGWADASRLASTDTTGKLNYGKSHASVLGSTSASVIEPKANSQKLWSSLFKSSASDMDKTDSISDMGKTDPMLNSSSSPSSSLPDKHRMDWESCFASSVDKDGHVYQAWDFVEHEEPVESTSSFVYSSVQNESISLSEQSKLFERQYTGQKNKHSEVTVSELNLQQLNELKTEWESSYGESQHAESSIDNDNVEVLDDGPPSLMGLKEEGQRDISHRSFAFNVGSEDRNSEVHRNSEVLETLKQVNPSDLLAVVAKLIGEVEGLKRSKLEQDQKIMFLERSKLEQDLKIMSLEQEVHFKLGLREPLDMHNRLVPGLLYASKSLEEVRLPQGQLLQDIHDSVVIVGGFDGSSWLPSLDSYFPLHDRVETLSPMAFSRSHAMAVKLNGEVFVLGGVHNDVWLDTVESYNPLRNQWTPQPSMNEKRGCLAGASLNDKIFAFGGGNGDQCFSEVEMFDLNIGNWISAQSMMQKRFASAAVNINGAIYVAGGYDGKAYMKYALGGYDGENMVSSVEILDPRFGSWVMGEKMNSPRGYSGAVVIGGKIFVIGGVNDQEEILDTIEYYEDGHGWKMTDTRTLGKRCFFSAVVL
ncbi:uncharacterized protein LOC132053658 isoform X2 [Lycium ferocissimum]|uniref:uncharacterized protein LOC132053658 isoform X2 n=1 Tax=Lycium ferocissimum TaxID=112874 RepID=UPI002815EEC7|nr:uncharacterized protein LOC132053658 isoform X2 [Lycium ferocissimum]